MRMQPRGKSIRTWCRLCFTNCFNYSLLLYWNLWIGIALSLPGGIVVTPVCVCVIVRVILKSFYWCEKGANCVRVLSFARERKKYTCPTTTTIVFIAISHDVSHLEFTWWQRKKSSSSSTNKSEAGTHAHTQEGRKDNIKMMGCGPYITDCETEKEIDYIFCSSTFTEQLSLFLF